MSTRSKRFAACFPLAILCLMALAACAGDATTPYLDAKQEFDASVLKAIADEMVPAVPGEFVVLGFGRTEAGVYKTSYLDPVGGSDDLELFHVAKVCVATDSDLVEQACGSQTESQSFRIEEFDGRYVLIFPENALREGVEVSANEASLVEAFNRGWDLWDPGRG